MTLSKCLSTCVDDNVPGLRGVLLHVRTWARAHVSICFGIDSGAPAPSENSYEAVSYLPTGGRLRIEYVLGTRGRQHQAARQTRPRPATREWKGMETFGICVAHRSCLPRPAAALLFHRPLPCISRPLTSRRAHRALLLPPTRTHHPPAALVVVRSEQIMNRMRRNSMSYELTEQAWKAAEKVCVPYQFACCALSRHACQLSHSASSPCCALCRRAREA